LPLAASAVLPTNQRVAQAKGGRVISVVIEIGTAIFKQVP
jgi:hypothetical protein